jgi:hypothetical protein
MALNMATRSGHGAVVRRCLGRGDVAEKEVAEDVVMAAENEMGSGYLSLKPRMDNCTARRGVKGIVYYRGVKVG